METARQRRFRWGFLAGALLAAGLNFLPYVLSRGAYQTDGLEVIGFPLTFRALGGFAYTSYFYWSAFAVDLLFCGTAGMLAGYASLALCRPVKKEANT
jgi:hypothetical protein